MEQAQSSDDPFAIADPSVAFGRNEGLIGYELLSELQLMPDAPVTQLADHAARIAIVAAGRFELNQALVTRAILEELGNEYTAE